MRKTGMHAGEGSTGPDYIGAGLLLAAFLCRASLSSEKGEYEVRDRKGLLASLSMAIYPAA